MSPEIDLLTALSSQPFSACEAQWHQLLRRLFLPISFVPAIQSVLEKGRWKSQPDPMAYVRKGSLRCAARLGILDVRRNTRREILATDLSFKDAGGKSLTPNKMTHDDRLGVALHRHDEQFRTGLGAERGAIYDEDDITNRLPSSVLDHNLEVKWERVADMAQMDSGERIVLQLQRKGLGRRGALAACYTDEDRKLLEAAWRRFDRKKETLKEVLQSGKAIPTKRQGANAGDQPRAEVEMVLIEVPGVGMKISFRKRVANRPE
ncbi:MAG: hypothetical protein ACRD72_01075 [Candidatus Angelobacter sp.]